MNFLQYKSDEMFSSTNLIRKSKTIFDKLSKDEIEKAVILRDGKPSFLLMDFAKYEAIMEEYIALKEQSGSTIASQEVEPTEEKTLVQEPVITEEPNDEPMDIAVDTHRDEPNDTTTETTKPKLTAREQAELDKALLELERVDKDAANKKREELKEFWD